MEVVEVVTTVEEAEEEGGTLVEAEEIAVVEDATTRTRTPRTFRKLCSILAKLLQREEIALRVTIANSHTL